MHACLLFKFVSFLRCFEPRILARRQQRTGRQTACPGDYGAGVFASTNVKAKDSELKLIGVVIGHDFFNANYCGVEDFDMAIHLKHESYDESGTADWVEREIKNYISK